MSTTINKKITFIYIALFLCGSLLSKAQSSTLDAYIQEAFSNNNGLKQQQLQWQKSLFALKEARSLFYPNVSVLGSYNKADGGRTIDLPIGDLFNPVYSTLNQITASNSFPTLKNESILLNPDNFYDAKFRTVLPLVDAEIYYNKKIKKVMISQQQAAVNVYKRELVKEVKYAYYQYYQASKAIDIYNNSLQLVTENIRVNESLLRNGVRNSTALTRAETEKQKINASITESENNKKNAQAYFNFLLNKPLTEAVAIDTDAVAQLPNVVEENTLDVTQREELLQLKDATAIYALNTKLKKAYMVPKLNTSLDLGSQGFNWQYNNKTQYYFWGVNLQWDLFAAGRNNYKIKQAGIDQAGSIIAYDDAEKSFMLQLTQALNNYNSALANYKSAEEQLQLATKYYSDQLKVYKEGQLLYIELIDALNQLTGAKLQESITLANVHIAAAAIERNKASYPINNK